jgi:hypothetical protein
MKIEDIARIVHEVNRVYCISIGDFDCKTWEESSELIKNSVIAGIKLQIKNPMSPEQSHHEWMLYKKAEGWKFGYIKNEGRKTHPNLVSYDSLDPRQRLKDTLFVELVNQLKGFLIDSDNTDK